MRPSMSRSCLALFAVLLLNQALVGCSDADTTDGSQTGLDIASALTGADPDLKTDPAMVLGTEPLAMTAIPAQPRINVTRGSA